MNRILFLACLLFPLLARAANPAFTQFNTNHFTTNGYFISARGFPTNASIATSVTNIIDTQLTNGNMVYVDARVGSDVLARRWNFNWPNLTPLGGKNTATNGDTVYVRPGIYTTGVTNLGKNMVDWYFLNPTLRWTEQVTNGPGAGFIDDRYSGGAITSRISGSVRLEYCSGTNVYFGPGCSLFAGNQEALGAIVITNANSEIHWDASTTVSIYGGTLLGPFALYVQNCKKDSFFKIDYVVNGSPFADNLITVTNCPDDIGTPYDKGLSFSFIYWELGTFTCHFIHCADTINGGYGIYAYGVTNTDDANMYLQGELMEGKIYMVGSSRTWKSWMNIKQIITTNQLAAYAAYGTATHYLTAQKVATLDVNTTAIVTTFLADNTNGVLYLNVQKVASPGIWIDSGSGSIIGTIEEFETSSGTMAAGILNRAGAHLEISGRRGRAPKHCVDHVAGTTYLTGYRWVSTNSPTMRAQASGLTVQGGALVGASNCIYASSAQTVKLYGHVMANTNEHSNVTISTGTLSVNGAVQ